MVSTNAPISNVDPFDDRFIADPWPEHERLRDAGPVVFLERYGVYGIARFSDVTLALQNAEVFSSGAGVGIVDMRRETPWRKQSIIQEADPPLHTRTHKVLLRALSPAALADLKPSFEAEAEAIVEAVIATGTCDGALEIARAFPLRVFADAVGIRSAGREHLLTFGDIVFNAIGPRNERLEKALAAAATVLPAIMEFCERSALSDDGIGARIFDAVDSGEITSDEASMLVRSVLSAGLDTTIYSIGSALLCLARAPDQFDRMRENSGLVRTAFDEAIRLEGPIQLFFRTTSRAIDVSGTTIPQDAKVVLFYASANRDPRRWDEPERYDIARRTGGHVGFGTGIHRCVGELLSRFEAEAVLGALARRAKTIRLSGEPVLHFNNSIRGYTSIPLTVT